MLLLVRNFLIKINLIIWLEKSLNVINTWNQFIFLRKKYCNHIGNLFIYFIEILNSFKSCGILPSCIFFPQDGFDRQSPSCIYESRRPLASVALPFLETISMMHLWVRETISICPLVPETVAIMHFSTRWVRGKTFV